MSAASSPLRISVVIPTYNRSQWIEPAIRTVLEQQYPVTEIIVVDDGSTDDTPRIVATLDRSVRVIRQVNAGVSSARNIGAQEACGDWVAFLDSDDSWRPEKLARQAAAIVAVPEARWCATSGDKVDEHDMIREEGRGLAGVFPLFREEQLEPDAFLRRWLTDVECTHDGVPVRAVYGDAFESLFTLNYVHASSVMIRRDAFLASGGFDRLLHVAEDTEFFHRLAAQHPLLLLLDELFGYRVLHGASLSNVSSVVPRIVNALTSIDRALAARQAPSPAARAAWRAARVRLLRRLAYARLTELSTDAARECLFAAKASGGKWDATTASILAASFLPVPVLRSLHALKRRLRSS